MFKNEAKKEMVEQYVCSLIDILGQKEKLIQINGISLKDSQKYVHAIFSQTHGIIKKFRVYTNDSTHFINRIKKNYALKINFTLNEIKIKSFSDLIDLTINYVLLRDDKNKLQCDSKNAKLFLDNEYNDLKIKSLFKVTKKYRQAIKYFEDNGIYNDN